MRQDFQSFVGWIVQGGFRRTVNIRFGTFYHAWWSKGEDPGDHHTGIFPLPTDELNKNSNLKQNPGY